jgi:hypothetical protein
LFLLQLKRSSALGKAPLGVAMCAVIRGTHLRKNPQLRMRLNSEYFSAYLDTVSASYHGTLIM